MTIASAPSGSGAPVMILHASPALIPGGGSPPAWLVPTMLNSTFGVIVRGPHGEAIHGGVVEPRVVDQRLKGMG